LAAKLGLAVLGTCLGLLMIFTLLLLKEKKRYTRLMDRAEDLQSDITELENARSLPESSIVLGEHRLGDGSYGEAWRGLLNGEPVCVKVLKAGGEYMDSLEAQEQYDKELSSLLRINHECVVGFRGAGMFSEAYPRVEVRGRPFLVLELMEGGALSKYLRAGSPDRLGWAHKLPILLDVARGVEYIHSKKWVYRDLKPGGCAA
jgi:hypothetical protein